MRWLACCVVLAGCVRARVTAVHPTDLERTSGDGSRGSIARTAPSTELPPQPPPVAGPTSNLGSVELGALIPFTLQSANVHLAPGMRVFGPESRSVLFGVAVGADFLGTRRGPGFALEGSVYAGDSSTDLRHIEQALDLFAGVTLHPEHVPGSVAIGPSLGILGMPGGHSVVMLGLGLRVMGDPPAMSLPATR